MPKYVNPPEILPIMAKNLLEIMNITEKDVVRIMCKLWDGIIGDDVIRRNLPKEYKTK